MSFYQIVKSLIQLAIIPDRRQQVWQKYYTDKKGVKHYRTIVIIGLPKLVEPFFLVLKGGWAHPCYELENGIKSNMNEAWFHEKYDNRLLWVRLS